jgi:phage terminase large subunit-like protein
VIAGEIIACHYVKLSCQRHVCDLARGKRRGLVFDVPAAQHRIAFYSTFLRHSKGEWARQPVELSPWQKFVIGSVFGWKRADGTRRFRYVYEELPRKNGKSTKLAGVGLDMLACDGEPGAEIYAAATKRDQARIIFDEAKRMVASSPDLAATIARYKLNLSIDATASKFEPLSSDDRTLDGLNPHCVLVDELHRHKTRALLDVLDTALGSRRQPLLWIITTAGDDDPESVYTAENDYAIKVLEGAVEDDNVFAFISTIDKGDRWDDPVAWAKANPNLGISVKLDDLERQARKAAKSAGALVAFKRLRLNVRSSAMDRVIDMAQWVKNSRGWFDPDKLDRRRCFAGLDLSSKIDISAFVRLYEPEEGGIMRIACRFWMPADTIEERADRDRRPYRRWVEEGWIEATPGNVIDHAEIKAAIIADAKRCEIESMAYDPWNATQLAVELNEAGVEAVEFVQGMRSYTAPTKELQALIADRKLDHGDNPVLTVMASNLKVQRDKNLNEMPNKAHSTGRIDGITALIMALGRRMTVTQRGEPDVFFV